MKVYIEHSKKRAIFSIILDKINNCEVRDVPSNVFEKGLIEVERYVIRYINEYHRRLARDAIITFVYNPYTEPMDYEILWEWS